MDTIYGRYICPSLEWLPVNPRSPITHASTVSSSRLPGTTLVIGFTLTLLSGCMPSGTGNGNDNGNGNGNGNDNQNGNASDSTDWNRAFQGDNIGGLTSVWVDGDTSVVMVGGAEDQGEVYRKSGDEWTRDVISSVEVLRDVFGFAPDDVYAVGDRGTFISFDGTRWMVRYSDTEEDLYGIWGTSADDIWIVGGNVGDEDPVIVRGDEGSFRRFTVPDNDLAATALFDVWGDGPRAWAVGENGLILELVEEAWTQVAAGEGFIEDFYAVDGTSASFAVAVGGVDTAQVALFDGESWTTSTFDDVPGLRAVDVTSESDILVAGLNGFIATFDASDGTFTEQVVNAEGTVGGLANTESGMRYAATETDAFPATGDGLIRFDDGGALSSVPEIIVSCLTSAQCDVPSSCEAGICVPLPACENDDDCEDVDDVCVGGGCIESDRVPCSGEPDCPLGEDCGSIVCEDAGPIDLQYYYNNDDGELELIQEGGVAPAFRGFQGGIHTFVSFQATGLTPGENVLLGLEIIRADDGFVLASQRTFRIPTTEPSDGITQALDVFVTFDRVRPGELEGVEAIIRMSISDTEDLALTDEYEQAIVLAEMDE